MGKVKEKRGVEPEVATVYDTELQAYSARTVHQFLRKYRISDVKLAPGLTLDDSTPLSEVIQLMQKAKTGCVVTKSDGAIRGIFTERDLLKKVMGEEVDWSMPIHHFTTREPVTMNIHEPLRKALYLMRKKNFRHIPVFDDEKQLLGVLSVRNVIRLFAEHFPQEVINLPPKLNIVSDTPEGG